MDIRPYQVNLFPSKFAIFCILPIYWIASICRYNSSSLYWLLRHCQKTSQSSYSLSRQIPPFLDSDSPTAWLRKTILFLTYIFIVTVTEVDCVYCVNAELIIYFFPVKYKFITLYEQILSIIWQKSNCNVIIYRHHPLGNQFLESSYLLIIVIYFNIIRCSMS